MSFAFRAAHSTLGSQVDSTSLPSIFDVLSQESLKSSMKPALQSLVNFLAQWYPQRFKILRDFYDEFYALFTTFLENHYLKHYAASFAENFYGMKRVLKCDSQKSFPLSDFRTRLKSLIFLVVVPYLADKIDKIMERLKYSGRRTKLISFLLRIYPYILSGVRVACVLVQVLYALRDFTPVFSFSAPTLPHLLVNVMLEKLTAADLNSFTLLPLHQGSGIMARLWRLILSATSIAGRLFSFAIFCLQFLQYFYANDLTRQFSALAETTDFSVPTAPMHPKKAIPSENYVLTSMDAGKCPLCYGTRVNDTALSVSGYVFCYSCIDEYLANEGRCPLTGLPATANHLIKLYVMS